MKDEFLTMKVSAVKQGNEYEKEGQRHRYDTLTFITSPTLIKPIGSGGFFVFNSDYAAYDTMACVGNLKKAFETGDMMDETEILALQRNEPANMDAVNRPSRSYLKTRKKICK